MDCNFMVFIALTGIMLLAGIVLFLYGSKANRNNNRHHEPQHNGSHDNRPHSIIILFQNIPQEEQIAEKKNRYKNCSNDKPTQGGIR